MPDTSSWSEGEAEGAAAFGVMMSDFALQLMFIVLLAGASLVAGKSSLMGTLAINPAVSHKGKLPSPSDEPILVVGLNQDGEILIDDDPRPISLADLSQRLTALRYSRSAPRVSIIPDAATPWERVSAVTESVAAKTDQYETLLKNTVQP